MKTLKKIFALFMSVAIFMSAVPFNSYAVSDEDIIDNDVKPDSVLTLDSDSGVEIPVFEVYPVSLNGDILVVNIDLVSGTVSSLDFRFVMANVECINIKGGKAAGLFLANPTAPEGKSHISMMTPVAGTIAEITLRIKSGFSFSVECMDCAVPDDEYNNVFVRPQINGVVSSETFDLYGSCGFDAYWEFEPESGRLTISGSGEMYNYSMANNSYWSMFLYDKITSVVIEEGVTSIGAYAFRGCTNLTNIEIPDDVENIGIYAFYDCASLTSITIPDSVTSIGNYAFYGCTSIKELTMPVSAKIYNSQYTFYKCTNIEKVTFSKGIGAMQNYGTSTSSGSSNTYYGYTPWYISQCPTIVIEDGVTSIGTYAFYDCSNLTGITIPDSVTSIGTYAFYDCTSLTSVTIPDGVTSIGDYTFYNCTSLTSITIPDSVTSIGIYAFYNCSNLASIAIPDSVTSIGAYAFGWCASLKNLTIGDSVATIGNYAFAYTDVTELVIPDSVTSIGQSILSGNQNVTKLVLPFIGSSSNSPKPLDYLFDYYYSNNNSTVPDSLKTIVITNATKVGNNTFRECSNIENITLNEGITSIGSYAFYHCSSLKEITIPDTVTNISNCAFNSCTAMKTVDLGDNPNLQINYNVFDNCDSVESYSIGSDNVNYCTDEYGVLYNKDKSGLIRYPTGNTREEYTVYGNVAYINENAFENSIYLKNVNLPNDIMSIGEEAFKNCTGLEKIVIPDGTYTVCHGAFEGCTSVTEITIPESLTELANYAFGACTSVEKIYYNASDLNAEEVKAAVFENCGTETDGVDVVFGDTVINIPASLFKHRGLNYWTDGGSLCLYCGGIGYHYCPIDESPNIKSVTIGENVKSIGENAFWNISSLTHLYFNATKCDFTNGAFSDCSALTNVIIGDGVKKVPSNFITNCDAVTDIVVPEGVTEIGDFAFTYNDALETVRFISTGEIIIGNDILQASYKAMICCKENSYMHSYAMMNGIKYNIMDVTDSPNFEIKNDVLVSYKGSAENVLVSSATRIGYGAFKGNQSLKIVELSSGVDRIFGNAFAGCTNLEKIIIPMSVSAIGDGAFSGCDNLTIWCYAGSYAESYAITNSISVEYIALEIDKSVVILNPDETTSVVALFNTTIMDEVDIVWTSSNPDVAIVNSSGVVTALKAGEATITATSSTGLSASCNVRVTEPGGKVHGVALGFNVTLSKGDQITVHPNIDADEGVLFTVEYSSSDNTVATVDERGTIIAVSAGMATIICIVTDEHGNTVESSIVVVVNNSADSFELSDDEIYISIGSEHQLTGIINPSTVENKEIVWESSNPSVATVDKNGNVKGLKAGVTVIIATTQEGGLKDFCLVKVVGVEAVSSASIDHEKGVITGLSSNTTSLDGFIELSDPTCNLNYDSLGTDSIVYVERDSEVVDAYTVVIFGDVNGDGWYDGTDSIIVSCLANGLLSKDSVSEAVYMAADCNHDGVIDSFDVALLEQAGLLLSGVDQSKSSEELSTDAAYIEYLDLIDQTLEIDTEDEIDTDVDVETDETPESDINTTPEQDTIEETNFFEMIMNFIKTILEMILTCIPVPWNN